MKRALVLIACVLIASLAAAGPRGALAQEQAVGRPQIVCFSCHEAEMVRPEWRKIPGEWRGSWHARHEVFCHDCHGGDPTDAALAMSPQRGFVGVPTYQQTPEFCGKCHIGILKHFLGSGHGKALKATGRGPTCVVCHGSHDIQKANIDIINEQRCTQCHTYDRARTMKQALALTEKKIGEIEDSIQKLKAAGVFAADQDKELFRIQAEFRTLFHTIDVTLVKEKTDSYLNQLVLMQGKVNALFRELDNRRNFAVFIMMLFIGMAGVAYLLAKSITK